MPQSEPVTLSLRQLSVNSGCQLLAFQDNVAQAAQSKLVTLLLKPHDNAAHSTGSEPVTPV